MDHTSVTVRRVCPLDWLLAVALLAGAAAAYPALRGNGRPMVVIYRDNLVVAQYPLNSDSECTVQGAAGPVRIRIADNAVRVVESACPRGLCIAGGAICSPGRQIVCAPGHVLVQIVSKNRQAPDAVAQ